MLVGHEIQCKTFVHYAVKQTDDCFRSETNRSLGRLKMFRYRKLDLNPHAEWQKDSCL